MVGVLGIAYNLNLYLKKRKNLNAAFRLLALVAVIFFISIMNILHYKG